MGVLAGAALAVALLAALGLRFWKRRPKKVRAVAAVPSAPPEVVARARLNTLQALLDKGDVLGFHVELSETLKVYLGRRYEADFVDCTTEEVRTLLQSELRARPAVAKSRDGIGRVLAACDMVKFARDVPERRECLAHMEHVAEVVDHTTDAVVAAAQREAETRHAGGSSQGPTQERGAA